MSGNGNETIYDVNPINFTAVISGGSGSYSIVVNYGSTGVGSVVDWFREMPSTVTINVTSSTVPSGYYLTATGDGSWTTVSSSSLVGTFTVTSDYDTWSFDVNLTDGTEVVASDPTVSVRRFTA